MPTVKLLKQDGSEVGQVELNEAVFGIEPNTHVLHETVLMQRSSLRQGTHKVKNRSEVRGGGRKPWRQKGTGRARQGSTRSPQWVGGGVVFGPTPRSYSYKMPKKVRRLALRSAYSTKVKEESIVVLESLSFDVPKTKEFVSMLQTLSVDKSALVVVANANENVSRSASNLKNVSVVTPDQVNVYDLIKHDKLIITKEAAEKIGEVLS